MQEISVSLLIALIGLLLSIYASLRNRDKETESRTESQAKISVKLDTICNTTNDIKADLKAMNTQIQDLNKEVIVQGQSLSTSWKRVDEHTLKLENHEKRLIQLEDTLEK